MVDMRKDGMSYRQIAEATGASVGKVHDTVVQVFKNEHLESPVAIKGADGKQYPAQQEPKTQAPQISMFVPGSEVIIEPKAAEEAARQNKSEKSEVIRQSRVDKILEVSANNQPLEDSLGTFNILYADPPWRYEHSATDSRQIENQYPTMTLEDICALPVGEITESDAILFLWATSPKLAEAMHVIDAWGFTYRSCMVWDKERMGMGYYARQQHELLLIAARGNLPVPEAANRPRSVIRIERDEKHSAKPHEFYTLIEKMYPEYRRVELFARNERVGWAAWGNQSCITLENV
jgi:N6-adenosine-specific RNA methylase IME4